MANPKLPTAQWVPINEVRPHPENPRFICDDKFNALVRSLKEFPKMLQLRPLVCDEEGVIWGGNQRHRAAKAAGMKTVPVIVAKGLSDNELRRFMIADNVPFGQWDTDILASNFDVPELENWGLDIDFMIHGPQGEDDDAESNGTADGNGQRLDHGHDSSGDGQDSPAAGTDVQKADPNMFPLGIVVNKVQQLQWSQIKDQLGTKRDSEAFTRLLKLLQSDGLKKLTA